MYTSDKLKWEEILKQSGVWFTTFIIYILFFSYNNSNYSYTIFMSAIIGTLTFAETLIFTKYLFPKFLYSRNYLLFSLYSFYVFVLTSYLIVLTIYGFLFFMFDFHMDSFPSMSKNFSSIFLLTLVITGMVCFFEILRFNHHTTMHNGELNHKITETELELKTRELNFLRTQLNPHFLFNTLNTLYGLAIKKSELTSDAILKLSGLLNYSLYQANKKYVLLKDELDHLNEYIQMETLRFKDQLEIKKEFFAISGPVLIPPMLLITFIENAFKHGRSADNKLKISMRLLLKDDSMLFIVINSMPSLPSESKQGGLGLKSMEKRLFLAYGDNYILRTGKTAKAFFSVLKINTINSSI